MTTDGPERIERVLFGAGILVLVAAFGALLLGPSFAAASESSSGEPSGVRPAFGAEFRGLGSGKSSAVETTAELTGTTTDEVAAALRDGVSLAAYAAEHGVAEADLAAAIVAAEEQRLDELVAAGRLTQEQAGARRADLEARVSELVNQEGLPGRGPGACDEGTDDGDAEEESEATPETS
jgi:hypothetical protein